MQCCLADAQHGYYTTRAGIGRDGDFTTAPEISQVFGELIGLWCAVVWQQMGTPSRLALVELGPGGGQLIDDALRAARIVPGFIEAIELHLVEINPTFRARQAERLRRHAVAPAWHKGLPNLHGTPTIIVANEFLDTLPSRQFIRQSAGWAEICVAVSDVDDREAGGLKFISRDLESLPFDATRYPPANVGDLITRTDFDGLLGRLNGLAEHCPLAALFIDYGHQNTALGDTLQAVRRHQSEHPLVSPGEADISVGVDFAHFVRAAETLGMMIDGPVAQGHFLGALGIAERASRLMGANPSGTQMIEAGVHRLMSETGMGARFHVVGLRSKGLAPLPGLE